MTHKKCGCLLQRSENNNCDAGNITGPRWRLHSARLSKGAKIYEKYNPANCCLLIYNQRTSFDPLRKKKNTIFFSIVQASARKMTSQRICLLIRENNYETATYNIHI